LRGSETTAANQDNNNVNGHYLKFEDDAENPSISLHSHKDMHIKAAGNVTNKIGGSSTTTIEEGNYVQLVGDTLKINAKTAVHFVCGQSRLSITNSDIIVEADEIAFDSVGAALAAMPSTSVPTIAAVPAPIGLVAPIQEESKSKHREDHKAVKGYGRSQNVTVIEYDDGCKEVRTGGMRAWRNHNPGNIAFDPNKPSYLGGIGHNGRFIVFPDTPLGNAAMIDLLKRQRYQALTLEGMIYKYAPPIENDSAAYTKFVSNKTHIPKNQVMSSLSPEQLENVAQAMRQYEGNKAGEITWEND
jgi:hypothetical protein